MTSDHESMDISDQLSGSEDLVATGSSDIDPEVLESKSRAKKKQRRVKKKATKEQKQISKIAKSTPLPHPATGLSTSVTQFAKLMMGLESSNSPLPDPPSNNEILDWTNHVEKRESLVLSKLNPKDAKHTQLEGQTSSKKAATTSNSGHGPQTAKNKATSDFLRNERLKEIRNEGLRLVNYTAAPEIPPNSRRQLISFQTKNACDKEFQLKGFSRITFEWSARSLAASQWNTATASILINHWTNWYKKQSNNCKDLEEDIVGILERWLGSMRKIYIKQTTPNSSRAQPINSDVLDQSTATGKRGDRAKLSAEDSRKHRKERKKIAEHRYEAAKALFPTNKRFATLFKDLRLVSDYEDNVDQTIRRIRITPRWRSDILTKVAHQLDEAAIQLQPNPRSRSNVANLLRRSDTKVESDDAEDPMEAPEKFPNDCYNPDYLERLTPIERRHIKKKDDIQLQSFLISLYKQTIPGYMNTDEQEPDNTAAPAGGSNIPGVL
ncbi:hypothetical protein PGTUg99_034605 [Puccinia graminis f. sp. tritici]|uniref:Uncharacterized protein n=1 Tax=Puccinia graminis f. sp. tritici TaxID=56615 RepID=A0A5B0SLJ3_PUCGR|nr:hypothetical protein PGTUg99_034605 [Puccinia graminis f. sp. tritici]